MRSGWKGALALTATALWLWFILARSAKPAAVSHAESSWVLDLLQRVLPFVTMRLVRKLAHFTEYAVLGALLWWDSRLFFRGRPLPPLGLSLLAAAGDETLQTFVPGRSGELRDVLLDFSGAAVIICLLWVLRRRADSGKEGINRE